jgi:hypothetical protein
MERLEGPMERRKSRIDVWKDTWIDHYFDLPLWGRAVLLGFLAALLMFAMDEAAHAFGYPWFIERLYENGLEGFVVGIVVYWLSRLREQRMDRRMREIGFLNHHIRNAMQTIELAATEIRDVQQREAIDLSVRRVVETLSRINRKSDELTLEGSPNYAA